MKSYSLILHGAVSPGPEAREALKVALHSILHFESAELDAVFSHLPSAIREGLTLEEAQKLQFSIESFDGDVELLEVESASVATNPDADEPIIPPAMLSAHKPTATDGDLTLAPAESDDIMMDGDNSWDDQTPIAKDVAPELEFNLDLGEPGAMSNQKPPAPPAKAKAADESDSDLSFEFGDSEAAPAEEPKSEGPKFVPPSVADLRFENEPEPVVPEPGAEVTEPDPVDIDFRDEESEQPSEPAAPQLSDAEIAARAFARKQSPAEDSTEPPPEEDWHKVQVDWTPSGSQSAVRNKPSKKLQLIFGGVVAIGAIGAGAFLLGGDDSQKMTITLPVDQLLKDQENILRPKKIATDKKRGVETVPFEKLWLSEKTLGDEKNRVALRLEVGRTALGFGIHEVEFTGEAPPRLTKQEYLRGDRLQPWLRRFEAFQRVLGGNGVAKTESDPNRFSAAITSKIFVEEAEQPSNFPGEFSVKAQYDSERDVVVGEWRLTNVDLPPQFSDTNLVRKTEAGYEVIFKGDFTASAVAPTPTPAPRVESTPEVASEAEEEEEAPKKPKGKKPKSAEGGKPGSSLMDD